MIDVDILNNQKKKPVDIAKSKAIVIIMKDYNKMFKSKKQDKNPNHNNNGTHSNNNSNYNTVGSPPTSPSTSPPSTFSQSSGNDEHSSLDVHLSNRILSIPNQLILLLFSLVISI